MCLISNFLFVGELVLKAQAIKEEQMRHQLTALHIPLLEGTAHFTDPNTLKIDYDVVRHLML